VKRVSESQESTEEPARQPASESLQSAASLQGVDGRESTVESAKSTVQYGNRRGTRGSTESAIVNTVSVRTACDERL
jgi:hypothetical protein